MGDLQRGLDGPHGGGAQRQSGGWLSQGQSGGRFIRGYLFFFFLTPPPIWHNNNDDEKENKKS
jgi:hypothetical protein